MLNICTRLHAPRRGLSLVELMVGITIGLFVVAAASIVVTTQLRENRQLLAETQLQQDLRAGADIIARELRRSGYNNFSETSVWNPDPSSGTSTVSPYQGLTVVAGDQGSITYSYRRALNLTGPFRYWVDNGVVLAQMGGGGAQELTDKNVLFVEVLNVVLATSNPVRLPCPNECPLPAPGPAGQPDDYCWPTTAVRDITVTITGRAVSDPSVRRTINSQVRLRNDYVVFNAVPPGAPSPPSPPSPPLACPE